jgi:hypothetical protein
MAVSGAEFRSSCQEAGTAWRGEGLVSARFAEIGTGKRAKWLFRVPSFGDRAKKPEPACQEAGTAWRGEGLVSARFAEIGTGKRAKWLFRVPSFGDRAKKPEPACQEAGTAWRGEGAGVAREPACQEAGAGGLDNLVTVHDKMAWQCGTAAGATSLAPGALFGCPGRDRRPWWQPKP